MTFFAQLSRIKQDFGIHKQLYVCERNKYVLNNCIVSNKNYATLSEIIVCSNTKNVELHEQMQKHYLLMSGLTSYVNRLNS
jgi:hypothetical protein